jgi:hypothetical protein
MINLPNWIPNLNAWMSALLLIVLAKGASYGFYFLYILLTLLLPLPAKSIYIIFSFLLISPIVLIAFVHHWLHLFLDRFFPENKSPEMANLEGWLPGLMSWWEGLFGWQVLAIAMLISSSIWVIFIPNASISNFSWVWLWYILQKFLTIATLIQLIVSAYLYQFEYLVRNYLMSLGTKSR